MKANHFEMSNFDLEVDGNTGVITDRGGSTMTVEYDPHTKRVREVQYGIIPKEK